MLSKTYKINFTSLDGNYQEVYITTYSEKDAKRQFEEEYMYDGDYTVKEVG